MKKNNRGQGMTEYLIIVALIAVSAIGVVRITSGRLMTGFGRIASALQGQKSSPVDKERLDESDVKGRDMSDFNENVERD